VLLFGGSQGADAVNAAGVDLARALAGRAGTQLFFVTGERMYDEVSESVLRAAEGGRPYEHIHIVPYAEKMWELFAVCDLVAARAGALTVTEIAAAGKPSILMPSPNVTNDHQTFNARVLSDAGAAVLLRDAEAAGGGLARETLRLLDDRDTMMKMGAAAQKLYLPGAADRIVDGLFGSSEA
ncbi:MAG: UDP-N-acetylglucosamine--N-acetylmuramyl-(pentapeptide) pyrophosphoryl-undecaprenol N-acetylglucosamine transferase, partial [Clostridiales Family XIII bacterium]|jgi:UDP-N-acetylglucosamine--N-acetylmuramyl-(pentapeptide) pyrophosphoryl-undecaprenol N-acetylglucosamine transferase|nr:UDP-N-acetylglucosamine--N-acetylmuramyl-(pentapeptide) pyrophosphoryl-undecaprenol N-acetylglucosamine transferase [Clostridiales Family XIII bacterium]